MDRRDYLIILYDFYEVLFSEKDKEVFEDYYFNNYSLSEISENLSVSRNAIHKHLKSIEKKLLFYEEKLKLYEKDLKLSNIINYLEDEDLKSELSNL